MTVDYIIALDLGTTGNIIFDRNGHIVGQDHRSAPLCQIRHEADKAEEIYRTHQGLGNKKGA